jgi:hypothetical protein
MKKNLLGFFAMAMAFTAVAQPQLTSNWCFQLGVTGNNIASGTTTFTSPTSGANQTWNYGSLASGPSAALNLVAPAQLPPPYNTNYPAGTTQAAYGDVNGTTQVMFMKKNTSEFSILKLDAGSTVASYSPRLLEAAFPMDLGDVETESYVINVNGTDLDATQTVTYLGYGTLTIPTGTFTNVICIKTLQEYDLSPAIGETYTWYKPGWASLLRVAVTGGGASISYAESATPTSVDENGVATAVEAFPNPATDVLFVNSQADKYSLKVFSATGALVAEEDVDNSDKQAYAVDLNSLSPGMYLLNINVNGTTTTKRFVKL